MQLSDAITPLAPPGTTPAAIELQALMKSFGPVRAVRNLDLTVAADGTGAEIKAQVAGRTIAVVDPGILTRGAHRSRRV
jgi:hypothetical protein